jgi:hypothetical protein
VAAVERDFEMLRGWCNGEWHWVGVVVTIYDAEDDEVWGDSVWGVEDNTDYWKTVALEFIEAGIWGIEKETSERAYWEARDVETVTA